LSKNGFGSGTANFSGYFFPFGRLDVSKADGSAFAAEQSGNGFAHSRGGTADPCDLIRESGHEFRMAESRETSNSKHQTSVAEPQSPGHHVVSSHVWRKGRRRASRIADVQFGSRARSDWALSSS